MKTLEMEILIEIGKLIDNSEKFEEGISIKKDTMDRHDELNNNVSAWNAYTKLEFCKRLKELNNQQ